MIQLDECSMRNLFVATELMLQSHTKQMGLGAPNYSLLFCIESSSVRVLEVVGGQAS